MELIMARSVLLVGHCGVDGPRLQRDISAGLPGTKVVRVNSSEDLEKRLEAGQADLLLVNREPVGFEGDGLEIVRAVHEAHPEAKVMLVSDLEEAQEEAMQAGALLGFGKRLMGTAELLENVARGLGKEE
jgi:DNA-binding NarL/FixJ family response regulator